MWTLGNPTVRGLSGQGAMRKHAEIMEGTQQEGRDHVWQHKVETTQWSPLMIRIEGILKRVARTGEAMPNNAELGLRARCGLSHPLISR